MGVVVAVEVAADGEFAEGGKDGDGDGVHVVVVITRERKIETGYGTAARLLARCCKCDGVVDEGGCAGCPEEGVVGWVGACGMSVRSSRLGRWMY